MTVEIPLHSRKYPGMVALVDDADYPLVSGYRWYVVKIAQTFYAMADMPRPNGTRAKVLMHRALIPNSKMVDHINHNGLDNCRDNLRAVTAQQNQMNRIPQGIASKYKGVGYDKRRDKWTADICAEGKRYRLGRFDSETDAGLAYDNAARELHREFAYLNFPERIPA